MSEYEQMSSKTPTWLIEKVDKRVALILEKGGIAMTKEAGSDFMFTFLDEGDHEMSSEEFERWERTCDRCGRFIPPDAPDGPDGFYTGHIAREFEGVQIVLAFGICGTCREDHMKGTEK